ncbi:SulP family inorganic anion transporter [Marinobacter sp.]|jgi:SulP family sulfate permease|uniref:SulP family inorganic anion transporter n=1 Tax=Marinobacter sp. TaxID=50741 RepID=UPI00387EB163
MDILLPAAVIALISFTEAMSSCRVMARRTGEPWNRNQELIGQGLAKIVSGVSERCLSRQWFFFPYSER